MYASLALGVFGVWLLVDSIRARAALGVIVLGALASMGDYFTAFSKYKVGPGPAWLRACGENARRLKCEKRTRSAIDECLTASGAASAACREFISRTGPYRDLPADASRYRAGQ